MHPIRVLLLPTDHSHCAEGARAVAESIVSRFDAQLHELRVATGLDPAAACEWPTGVDVTSRDSCDVTPATLPIVHAVRASDSVGRGILNYAREIEAGLIVMGTHGGEGVDRLVSGSTSEYVLRRAECPVLLVPLEAAGHVPDNGRVLVAHDFSPPAAGALATAVQMARAFDASLDVLHVVEVTQLTGPFWPVTAAVDYDALRVRAERLLTAVAASETAQEPPARVSVRVGIAAEEILTSARESEAGLIIIGSHGRRGVGRMFLGSVSEEVARRAPCPVLVVRSAKAPHLEACCVIPETTLALA